MSSDKARTVTPDEKREFELGFRETVPLVKSILPKSQPLRSGAVGPTGIDGGTAERLRKGLLEPDAKLDLHGYTEQAAYRTLSNFLRKAHQHGMRLVLVVTGKGAPAPGADEAFDLGLDSKRRGVLKGALPRWLGEPDLAGLIAQTVPAHRKHGGDGAVYIYLRKPF